MGIDSGPGDQQDFEATFEQARGGVRTVVGARHRAGRAIRVTFLAALVFLCLLCGWIGISIIFRPFASLPFRAFGAGMVLLFATIMAAALDSVIVRWRIRSARHKRVGEPWTWRPEWNRDPIRGALFRSRWLLVVVASGNLLSLSALFGMGELLAAHAKREAVPLILWAAAAGALALVVLMAWWLWTLLSARREAAKLAGVHLSSPQLSERTLGGALLLRQPLVFDDLRLRITCERIEARENCRPFWGAPYNNGWSFSALRLWEQSVELTAHAESVTRVPFEIEIPEGLPSSSAEEDAIGWLKVLPCIQWTLRVESGNETVDVLDIPVFATQ